MSILGSLQDAAVPQSHQRKKKGCRSIFEELIWPSSALRCPDDQLPEVFMHEFAYLVQHPLHLGLVEAFAVAYVRHPRGPVVLEFLELHLEESVEVGHDILPFVNSAQYNIDIKDMLKIAGVDRIVTVMKDGVDERHPICDEASSHMARRTFVGNLYKKVKDPNLIGKLSGHVEGTCSNAGVMKGGVETSFFAKQSCILERNYSHFCTRCICR